MSVEAVRAPRVPAFNRADRMRKALEVAEVTVQEMADYLGVTRGTVSTWINNRISPSRRTVLLWAMRTGVPAEWLETGEDPSKAPPPGLEPGTCGLTVDRSHRWLKAVA